jgi:hypothetical protein
MPIIPAFKRQRQNGLELEVRLVYITRSSKTKQNKYGFKAGDQAGVCLNSGVTKGSQWDTGDLFNPTVLWIEESPVMKDHYPLRNTLTEY